MKVATATKDQLRVWKVASKEKSREVLNLVHLDIKRVDKRLLGYLVATDSYSLMKREVEVEPEVTKPMKLNIPNEALHNAEKLMSKADRAFIHDDQIVVVQVDEDENTGMESFKRIAVVPYVQQTSMNFPDYETMLEKYVKDIPEMVVTLNAKILKDMADQMKDGDQNVSVKVALRPSEKADQPVFLTANEGEHELSITAVIMPLRS